MCARCWAHELIFMRHLASLGRHFFSLFSFSRFIAFYRFRVLGAMSNVYPENVRCVCGVIAYVRMTIYDFIIYGSAVAISVHQMKIKTHKSHHRHQRWNIKKVFLATFRCHFTFYEPKKAVESSSSLLTTHHTPNRLIHIHSTNSTACHRTSLCAARLRWRKFSPSKFDSIQLPHVRIELRYQSVTCV